MNKSDGQFLAAAATTAAVRAREGEAAAKTFFRSQFSLPEVRSFLESEDIVIRRKALFLLPFYGRDETFDDLCRVLRNDSSTVVKHEAAFLLGATGLRKALGPLRQSITDDPSDLVRHEAIEALGDLGYPESRDFLTHLTSDKNPDVAETARLALQLVEELVTSPARQTDLITAAG